MDKNELHSRKTDALNRNAEDVQDGLPPECNTSPAEMICCSLNRPTKKSKTLEVPKTNLDICTSETMLQVPQATLQISGILDETAQRQRSSIGGIAPSLCGPCHQEPRVNYDLSKSGKFLTSQGYASSPPSVFSSRLLPSLLARPELLIPPIMSSPQPLQMPAICWPKGASHSPAELPGLAAALLAMHPAAASLLLAAAATRAGCQQDPPFCAAAASAAPWQPPAQIPRLAPPTIAGSSPAALRLLAAADAGARPWPWHPGGAVCLPPGRG